MKTKYNTLTVTFAHTFADIELMVTAEIIPGEDATRTEPGCEPMINEITAVLLAAPNAGLVDIFELGLEDELSRIALELACD